MRLTAQVIVPEVQNRSTHRKKPGHYFPGMAYKSVPPPPVLSPVPRPQTLDAGIGRDANHAPTPIVIVQNYAIEEWTHIAAPHFIVPRVPGALVISQPQGRMNPFRERVNIARAKPRAQGDGVQIEQQNYGPLSKLMLRLTKER